MSNIPRTGTGSISGPHLLDSITLFFKKALPRANGHKKDPASTRGLFSFRKDRQGEKGIQGTGTAPAYAQQRHPAPPAEQRSVAEQSSVAVMTGDLIPTPERTHPPVQGESPWKPGNEHECARTGAHEAEADDIQAQIKRSVETAGQMVEKRLDGNPGKIREIEDILQIPFSTEAAEIAALVVIHAIARTGRTPGGTLNSRAGLLQQWEQAATPGSSERFVPVTKMAAKLLRTIGETPNGEPTRTMAHAAENIQDPSTLGDLIQRLVPDRKALGTYYTRQASATLMARLSVPDPGEWTSPEDGRCRIADYACGTGTLLRAAAMRVRELHSQGGGDPALLHQAMMEEDITAVDVLPASVAIAVTELHALEENPAKNPEGTQGFTLRYGPIDRTPDRGSTRNRLMGMGALDILHSNMLKNIPRDPIARAEGHSANPIYSWPSMPAGLKPHTQDLVIMNPPFNREQLEPMPPVGNSRPTTKGEKEMARKRLQEVRALTQSNTTSGLAYHFSILAHRMVRPGGTIALLLSETSLVGGTKTEKGWMEFRRIIAQNYRNIRVIGITGFEDRDSNFSQDTQIAEVILIAQRRLRGQAGSSSASFISTNRQPQDDRDAQVMSDTIMDILWKTGKAGIREIQKTKQGDLEVRGIRAAIPQDGAPWRETRVAQYEINTNLAKMVLPGKTGSYRGKLPTAPLSEIAQIGPASAMIGRWKCREPTGLHPGWPRVPALTAHRCDEQRSIETEPNATIPMDPDGKLRLAILHINDNFRFNSQSTGACTTSVPSVGSNHWPTIDLNDQDTQRLIAIWMNTTMGLISHWNASSRTQQGLGYINSTSLKNLRVLDPRALSDSQLDSIQELFNNTKHTHLLAANEAWRDPVRMELDRHMLDILGATDEIRKNIEITRIIWCREPTVISQKGKGERHQKDMDLLNQREAELLLANPGISP